MAIKPVKIRPKLKIKLSVRQLAFNQRHKNKKYVPTIRGALVAVRPHQTAKIKLTARQRCYNQRHKNLTGVQYKKLQQWAGNRHIMHHYLGLRTYCGYPNG